MAPWRDCAAAANPSIGARDPCCETPDKVISIKSVAPAMPRLFTALEIPADVGQSLALLRGGLPGARWIDPENYHLTLRFIGDVDDVLAREVAYLLGGIRRPAFRVQLDGLDSFGGHKPRAVVAPA